MARLWQLGAELNSTTSGHEAENINGATVDGTIKRSGDYSYKCASVSAYSFVGIYNYTVSQDNLYLRCYFYIDTSLSGTASIFAVMGFKANLVAIKLTSTNKLQLWNTEDNVQIGSDSDTLNTGQWYQVEMRFDNTTLSSTYVEAKIDGNSAFASGTINLTNNLSNGSFDFGIYANTVTGTLYIDDIAINDDSGSYQNSYPGYGKIVHLRPEGDGEVSGWAASSGNDYECVDEVTPNDITDYISSTTLDQESLFTLTDPPTGMPESATINVVAVNVRYRGDNASSVPGFKVELEKESGGTKSLGTELVPTATTWYTNRTTVTSSIPTLVTYLDPDGAAWTKTSLTSSRVGAKTTTDNTNNAQISTLWVSVDYDDSGTVLKTDYWDVDFPTRSVKTHEIDGIITEEGGTYTKTHTVDGIVLATQEFSWGMGFGFTSDGIVLETNVKTNTSDGVVIASSTKTNTIDAIIQASEVKSNTADGIVKATVLSTDIYIFNASDGGPNDPGGVWNNDADAFDDNQITAANPTATGSTSSNYLEGLGTTAPTIGNTITRVRAMFRGAIGTFVAGELTATYFYNSEELGHSTITQGIMGGNNWSSLTTLTTPDGGWTWQKANDLKVRFWAASLGDGDGNACIAAIEVTAGCGLFVDAIICETKTKTHTVDGLIRETFVQTNTADGIIKSAGTETITADGIILETSIKTNTVDGIIIASNTKTNTADAIVKATSVKTNTADGIILAKSVKSITSDAVVLATKVFYVPVLIDSYSETYTDSGLEIVGPQYAYGQAFPNVTAATLASCKFYLKKETGAEGVVVAQLYAITGTYGTNAKPTGSVLASSEHYEIGKLTDSYQLITFEFTDVNRYALGASTNYVITVANWRPNSYRVYVGADSAGSHGGNYSYNSFGSWTGSNNYDASFYLYRLGQLTADAIITSRVEKTNTADGIVKETLIASNTVDGLIAAGGEKTYSVDAIVSATSEKTNTADGIIENHKRYWVNDGGNWSDTGHWSYESGGSSGAPEPTSLDDVYFDSNSFDTGGQYVSVNTQAECKDMDWTGVTNTPTFRRTSNYIIIYGNITLSSAMALDYVNWYFDGTGSLTFDSGGIDLDTNPIRFNLNDGDADYTLTNTIVNAGSWSVGVGTFTTGGYDLEVGGVGLYNLGSGTTINLGDSIITVYADSGLVAASAGVVVNPGTSKILITGADCSVEGNGTTWNDIEAQGTPLYFRYSQTINNFKVTAGNTVYFDPTYTITVSSLDVDGTAGNLTELYSDTVSQDWNISKASGTVTVNYCDIRDSNAVGGATFYAVHSTDSGNNTGWIFVYDKTHTADGYLVDRSVKDHTVDGIVKETIIATNTLDALISVGGEKTYTVDGIILVTDIKTITVDGVLTAGGQKTFDVDGIVWEPPFPLTDNFNDNSLDTEKWEKPTSSYNNAAEQNQELEIISTASGSSIIRSRGRYLLTGRRVQIKITNHSTDGGFKLGSTFGTANWPVWDIYSEANWYNFQPYTGNVVRATRKVSGGSIEILATTPVVSTPYWLRMWIDDSGYILFEYGGDGSNWTTLHKEAWALGDSLATTEFWIWTTAYDTPTTGELHVDDYSFQSFSRLVATNTADGIISEAAAETYTKTNTADAIMASEWDYQQYFNSLTNGTLESQDSWIKDTGGDFLVGEYVTYEGSKSVKLTTSSVTAWRRPITFCTFGTVYFAVRKSNYNGDLYIYLNSDYADVYANIKFDNDGKYYYYNYDTTYEEIGSWTVDQWYFIGITFNTIDKHYKYNVNGGAWSDWISMNSDSGDRVNSFNIDVLSISAETEVIVDTISLTYVEAPPETRTKTYTIDGIVQETFIQTNTADGIIKQVGVVTPTADGIVLETSQKQLTLDGIVVQRVVKTSTADGVVLVTQVKTATADALIATTCFQDNFNRSDGPLGSDWSTTYGTVSISSNLVTPSAMVDLSGRGKNALVTMTGTMASADVYVEAYVTGVDVSKNKQIRLFARASNDGKNHYGAQFRFPAAGGNDIIIYRDTDLSFTNIGSISGFGGYDNNPHTYRMQVKTVDASTVRISCYRDGNLLGSYDDTSGSRITTTGTAGIHWNNWDGTQVGVNADDFHACNTLPTVTVKSGTADGIISVTSVKTNSADGIISSTEVKTHTADGIIEVTAETGVKTHTIDGIVRETFIDTFTVDGIIKDVFVKTYTIDAVIRHTDTKTHTADGIILITLSTSFTVDGILFATSAKTMTLDGIIAEETEITLQTDVLSFTFGGLATKVKTHSIDGYVRDTFVKTNTVDALVKLIGEKTHTVDAIVSVTSVKTHTVDGIIFSSTIYPMTVDGIISQAGTALQIVDAIILATYVKTNTVDGIVVDKYTKTHTVDAIILQKSEKTFTVDGIIKLIGTKTHTADGIILVASVKTHTVDGIVFATSIVSMTVDGLISQAGVAFLTVDGIVRATTLKTVTADGYVAERRVKTFTVDGIVRETFIKTHTADGIIRETKTKSFTVDGIVWATSVKTHTIDLIVREAGTKLLTIDGIVRETFVKTSTADGVIKTILAKTHTVDGIVAQVGNVTTVTADGVIKAIETVQHTIDGFVAETTVVTHQIDAIIFATGNEKQMTVDAVIRESLATTITVDAVIWAESTKTITVDGIVRDTFVKTNTADGILVLAPITITIDAIIAQLITFNPKLIYVDGDPAWQLTGPHYTML